MPSLDSSHGDIEMKTGKVHLEYVDVHDPDAGLSPEERAVMVRI